MDIENTYQTPGNLKISEDVIASIARFAALECEGIDSVSTGNTGVKGLITKTSYVKPIKIELNDGVVAAEVSVVVKQGERIPALASEVQKNVKIAIQSMTGLAVSKVDVVIAGITLARSTAAAE